MLLELYCRVSHSIEGYHRVPQGIIEYLIVSQSIIKYRIVLQNIPQYHREHHRPHASLPSTHRDLRPHLLKFIGKEKFNQNYSLWKQEPIRCSVDSYENRIVIPPNNQNLVTRQSNHRMRLMMTIIMTIASVQDISHFNIVF